MRNRSTGRRGRPRHLRRHSSFLLFGPTRWRMGSGCSWWKTTPSRSLRARDRRRGLDVGSRGKGRIVRGDARRSARGIDIAQWRRPRARRGDDRDRRGPAGFTTVSSAFAPALGLMAEMLTKPAFDSSGSSDENRRKPPRPAESPRRRSRFRGISSMDWSTATRTRLSARSCRPNIDRVDHASRRRPFL